MRRLTGLVLRHKLVVVLGWVLLAGAGAATATHTINRFTDSYAMPGLASQQADQRVLRAYGNGGQQEPIVPVVTVPPGQTLTPDNLATAARVLDAAAVRPGIRTVGYPNTHDERFLTQDRRSTFALVFTPRNPKQDGLSDLDRAVAAAVRQAAPPGWTVNVTGMRQLTNASPPKKSAGVAAESMLGGLGALVVLVLVFASLLVVLPLLVAAVSILTVFLLLGGLSELTDVSFIVEYLVALIGLGVAVDYSLLVLTRWREERARGAEPNDAAVEAMAAAGRAVVFSGLTVAIGLLALVVLNVPFLRSIGLAGMLIPLVSMAVAVTLLPVLLATVGDRLEWPHERDERAASTGWLRWAQAVHRHKVVAAAAGLVALVALATPLLGLRLGEPRTSTLSQQGPARTALDALTSGGVPSGVLTPLEVLVRGNPDPVAARLRAMPGIDAAVSPAVNRRSGTALVDVLPVAEAGQGAGKTTVAHVRDLLERDPAVLGVAGVGPSTIDAVHAIYGRFALMLTLVAVVTFLLLARALRSIALAVKAVLLNLLSVGAAYGVLVMVWQWGWGSHAIWGVRSTGAVTFWVPIFVFAFLFGLSMDYEVFILARIREEYDRTGSTARATVEGLARTGRLVTSAACILALAFLAMSTGPQTDIKILATGLGAGIIVDALVVRSLVVPALVSLLGDWNWWLPRSLRPRRQRVVATAERAEPAVLDA
ncbi:MAG TPA: MMPL family transporter [Mycobacteriales bacterium]|nr:MMPL family transporter [Mycobacteriales bacterium]